MFFKFLNLFWIQKLYVFFNVFFLGALPIFLTLSAKAECYQAFETFEKKVREVLRPIDEGGDAYHLGEHLWQSYNAKKRNVEMRGLPKEAESFIRITAPAGEAASFYRSNGSVSNLRTDQVFFRLKHHFKQNNYQISRKALSRIVNIAREEPEIFWPYFLVSHGEGPSTIFLTPVQNLFTRKTSNKTKTSLEEDVNRLVDAWIEAENGAAKRKIYMSVNKENKLDLFMNDSRLNLLVRELMRSHARESIQEAQYIEADAMGIIENTFLRLIDAHMRLYDKDLEHNDYGTSSIIGDFKVERLAADYFSIEYLGLLE